MGIQYICILYVEIVDCKTYHTLVNKTTYLRVFTSIDIARTILLGQLVTVSVQLHCLEEGNRFLKALREQSRLKKSAVINIHYTYNFYIFQAAPVLEKKLNV